MVPSKTNTIMIYINKINTTYHDKRIATLVFLIYKRRIQGSLSRVYGLLITRVSLKINGGMWLI